MVTVLVLLVISTYMLMLPAHWLKHLMQLSKMGTDFKILLILLGVLYLAAGWVYEKQASQALARFIGRVKERVTGTSKRRKEYKVIAENMRM